MCAQCKKLIEIHNGELAHRGRTFFLFCCSVSSEQLCVKPEVFNILTGNEDFLKFLAFIPTVAQQRTQKFKLHQRQINTTAQKTENYIVWFTKRVRSGGLWRTKQRYLQSHLNLDEPAVTHLSPLHAARAAMCIRWTCSHLSWRFACWERVETG